MLNLTSHCPFLLLLSSTGSEPAHFTLESKLHCQPICRQEVGQSVSMQPERKFEAELATCQRRTPAIIQLLPFHKPMESHCSNESGSVIAEETER